MKISTCTCAAIAVLLLLTVSSQRITADQVIGFVDYPDIFDKADVFIDGYYSGSVGDYIPLEVGRRDIRFRWKHSYWMRLVLVISDDSVEIEESHALRDECAIDDDDWSEIVRYWGPATRQEFVEDTVLFDIVLLPPEMESRSSTTRQRCTTGHYAIGSSNYTKKSATISISSSPAGAEIMVQTLESESDLPILTNNTVVAWHNNRNKIRIVLRLKYYANCIIDVDTRGRGNFEDSVHCDLQREIRTQLPQ